jgi:hypothetical protein
MVAARTSDAPYPEICHLDNSEFIERLLHVLSYTSYPAFDILGATPRISTARSGLASATEKSKEMGNYVKERFERQCATVLARAMLLVR